MWPGQKSRDSSLTIPRHKYLKKLGVLLECMPHARIIHIDNALYHAIYSNFTYVILESKKVVHAARHVHRRLGDELSFAESPIVTIFDDDGRSMT